MSTENSRDSAQPSQALSPLLSPLTHSYLPSHFCGLQEEAPGRRPGFTQRDCGPLTGPAWVSVFLLQIGSVGRCLD